MYFHNAFHRLIRLEELRIYWPFRKSLSDLFHFISMVAENKTNFANKNAYQLGTAIFSSAFISKHLMFSWLKGDWTTIMQLRNEIRFHDKIAGYQKEASGSLLFFAVPQVIYGIKEKWHLSAMVDIPIYQYFSGTQLGAGVGITFSLSRTFNMDRSALNDA